MDPEMQELVDAVKCYIEWKSGAPDDHVCFNRLEKAVKALESPSTAQILDDVQAAMNKGRLIRFITEYSGHPQSLRNALGEAIQAWHDAE